MSKIREILKIFSKIFISSYNYLNTKGLNEEFYRIDAKVCEWKMWKRAYIGKRGEAKLVSISVCVFSYHFHWFITASRMRDYLPAPITECSFAIRPRSSTTQPLFSDIWQRCTLFMTFHCINVTLMSSFNR